MACIVKKHHLKVLFKEMQFVAFFIFHMGKTRMQVKNDLRCLRQTKLSEYSRSLLFLTVAEDHFSKTESHVSVLRIIELGRL